MKEWMQGPFLDIAHILNATTAVKENPFPDLFERLFDQHNRESALYDFITFYYTESIPYSKAEVILQNFSQCSNCENWFDRDDLIDTEQIRGGGVGHVCEDCVNTLG
jgi:hypothetical protein